VGVNESKMLRWLIRNRQSAGSQRRYEDERSKEGAPTEPATPPPAPPPPPPAQPPPDDDGSADG
ncbi:MAG TPA: hypothetical protein VFE44_02440, partial [Thermoanaerobaculia bacterium]|nr:hypothetical protein [Thermoanaerobaculia bacterium]